MNVYGYILMRMDHTVHQVLGTRYRRAYSHTVHRIHTLHTAHTVHTVPYILYILYTLKGSTAPRQKASGHKAARKQGNKAARQQGSKAARQHEGKAWQNFGKPNLLLICL